MGLFDNYQQQINLSELINLIRVLDKGVCTKYSQNPKECEEQFKKLIGIKIKEITFSN